MSGDSTRSPLGFLAIQVDIHRPPGDPFNCRTWSFPLIHELVEDSGEAKIVTKDPYDDDLLARFVRAGISLAERGAVGLITSCGFLALAQDRLASQLPIPLATSALLQIPSILILLPKHTVVGVLTYDSARLGAIHLQALGLNASRIRIRGMPAQGHLRKVIQCGAIYEASAMEREMVEQAMRLIEEAELDRQTIGAIVLECTQMPPYAEAIQRKTGLPIYDVYTMGEWFYNGLVRRMPVGWREDIRTDNK
ncbi:hypothetical protein GT037_008837 [Alternaria burnsii]|uniref:Aspartate/glutamate racemase family protein n=1 Tax=Alternaria burnsii TaxID=1187904 RepID=A0A8H7AX04_9PLEO|nr:uncharacterized protein GT037_008837 [Alternaria burnsii]KAF7672886.1 hypothetical protein GT037_008837 [Alternaria burnsii]